MWILNKKVLTKQTSAVFLAIVLVTGTIALAFPSFIVGAAQATSDRDKNYDNDDKKKSYGKDRDRDGKSRNYHDDDKTNKYDDYESTKYPSEYTDKRYNSYGPEYGMDNDYKNHYGKDNYESQYSSYEKDNSYKSKKDNANIKKVKCNNINVNFIGDNTGDINVGNNGRVAAAEDGTKGDLSSSSFGNGERYYDDGYNNNSKQDKDSICINNNTIVVGADDGGNTTGTCEDCFNEILSPEQIDDIITLLISEGVEGIENLEDVCTLIFLNSEIGGGIDYATFVEGLVQLGIPLATANKLVECLISIGTVFIQV